MQSLDLNPNSRLRNYSLMNFVTFDLPQRRRRKVEENVTSFHLSGDMKTNGGPVEVSIIPKGEGREEIISHPVRETVLS